MTGASLPLADARSLGRLARRTRLLRLGLAAALTVAALSAVLLARGPQASAGPFVPSGSNTIVVLDVSQSVEFHKLELAYSTLAFLGHSKAQVGLVVFSSYAYEALPPGSPANALLPVADLFHPTHVSLAFGQVRFGLPPNPWASGFSSGTEIASGLQLAREIIAGDRLIRPSVVLISDLLDDTSDLARVTAEGKAYQQDGIPLKIVGLEPAFGDLQFFLHAAGKQGSVLQAKVPKQVQLRVGFPTSLVAVALVLAVLLALDEALFAPLRWGLSRIARELPA